MACSLYINGVAVFDDDDDDDDTLEKYLSYCDQYLLGIK